ncbi:palmitoyltransferase ZDHHC3 [Lepeophtheirus salmonis]|uniref:palmitoyltransferase ZDHHC3 n=1 Tax=Lepeophtheirus salmonis TaxID=72036 RepID=UPI001AE17688|nr:palmitoyltransferase ZDHHC3-like [Lepeophtheirus salmonis]
MVFIRGDPCGIICLLMTYGAVFYADYVVVRWIVLQSMNHTLWGSVHVVLFNVIVFLLFMAHGRAVFSDPGIVPPPKHKVDFSDIHSDSGASMREDWTVCTRCEMYRPPRAYHCRICRHCIRRMDHHCPWINNCVGEWNQKFFLQFLFYVGVLSSYSIALVASSWYIYEEKDPHIKQTRILHSVILVLESLLFGMFVIAIGCDQFEAIFTDETLVEQAKKQGPFRPNKPKMTLLAEVCGRVHPLTWLLPCYSAPIAADNLVHPINSTPSSSFTV